jgi:hypothetical protein
MTPNFQAIKEGYSIGDNAVYFELDGKGRMQAINCKDSESYGKSLHLNKDALLIGSQSDTINYILTREFLLKALEHLDKRV